MSKSLARVKAALLLHGATYDLREMTNETRSAEQAARAVGCELDQIVKSILFIGSQSGKVRLFLTAGGNRVSAAKASTLVGEALEKADASLVRQETGFAIGGVAPMGHLSKVPVMMDPRLLDFQDVWAAAGTPRHIFSISPVILLRISAAQLGDFTG